MLTGHIIVSALPCSARASPLTEDKPAEVAHLPNPNGKFTPARPDPSVLTLSDDAAF